MTREEAIDILFGVIQANSEEENEALDMTIKALPSADRPQGKWIETDMRCYGATVYKCSVCGAEIDEMPTVMGVPKYRGCPYCLARMKGADDES